jgi:hypothetical protein
MPLTATGPSTLLLMPDRVAYCTRSASAEWRGLLDGVVTHHRDGFRSGVARFNELLAGRLGVPVFGVFDEELARLTCPLLSFKVGEMTQRERKAFSERLEEFGWQGEVFLHDFRGLPLELQLVRRARRVHCGNHEVLARVQGLNPATTIAWSPGLILDDRPFTAAEISVFSFGMAHKIRTDMFQRLRALLDASGRSYTIFVSAANHETTKMRDAELVFAEIGELFPPDRLYFLGNLSDVAVSNYLRQSTFFAAFFLGGVRANNGSVSAAMEKGSVVVTNLDEFSPPEFRHMENVVDIQQSDELPLALDVLEEIGRRASETARARDWQALVEALR